MAWDPSNSTFGTMRVGYADDALGRHDGSEHVGHMGDRDEADLAVRKQSLIGSHVEFAEVGDRGDPQFDPVQIA